MKGYNAPWPPLEEQAMRRSPTFAILAAALLVSAASAASPRKDLTVAEALRPGAFGGGQPREVTWAPGSKAFYYLEPGAKGKAGNLMACDAATLAKTPVLTQTAFRDAFAHLANLKGEEAAQAAFRSFRISPKGSYLLLETSGGPCLWNLATRTLKRLATEEEGADTVTFSPDETRVAFTAKGNLYDEHLADGVRTTLAEGKAPFITCGAVDWLYGEELDMDRALWWSPDGTKVAFLRFDETGVYQDPMVDESVNHPEVKPQFYPRPGDVLPRVSLHWVRAEGGPVHEVPGAMSDGGYLPRALWLPSGTGLVYALYNRAQDRLVLYQAGLEAGGGHKVWEESWPTWVNVPPAPLFLKDDRFLWLSERDGTSHIYLCSLDGKPPLQLTRGPWAVDAILGVDEAKGRLVFSCDRDGATGCQIYRTDLKGGKEIRLSDGRGWHAATCSPDARWYLDSASSAAVPDVLSLVSLKDGKARVVAPNPAPELEEYGFVRPEFMTVTTPDGTALNAWVIKPRDFDPAKKYPVIAEVYGGPHAQIVQDRWNGRWIPIGQLFAQNGFVCFAVDNRGSARRGKAFEDVLFKRLGKAELADQLAGLEALKKLPYVDGSRIGLWGWSYGGFMTTYALTHAGAYACGFAVAPVTDWLNYDACYTERYLKLPKDNPEGYKDSSPVNAAGGLHAPYYLAQGLMDNNVHFENSARMADAFYKAEKPFLMAYYPRMDHGIAGKEARRDLFTRMLEFFTANLKP